MGQQGHDSIGKLKGTNPAKCSELIPPQFAFSNFLLDLDNKKINPKQHRHVTKDNARLLCTLQTQTNIGPYYFTA